MKASELIKLLQVAKARGGDLDVMIYVGNSTERPWEQVAELEIEDHEIRLHN